MAARQTLQHIGQRLGRLPRWQRWPLRALAALLALWLLLWLAVPPLARWQIETQATRALGRAVSVERVEFRPWSLEATVQGLRVAGLAGQPAQLEIGLLHADIELQSLIRRAPVIDALRIERPRVRLAHLGDGRYDIDDITARLAPKPGAPAGEPLRMALFNLVLDEGELRFDDRAAGKLHSVQAIRLAIPFLSNLPSQRQVKVQPQLAFTLGGSRFDTAAQATPFGQTRDGQASLRVAGLDLRPYLGYLPPTLPVRLRAAVLDLDLRLDFSQSAAGAQLRIGGTLGARGIDIATPAGRPLLALDNLRLALGELRPLERMAALDSLELQAPRLALLRRADGQIALDLPAAARPAASGPASAAKAASTASGAAPWRLALRELRVQDGAVDWRDEQPTPTAALALDGLSLQAQALSWPLAATASASLQASASVGAAAANAPRARLALDGSADARSVRARLQVQDFALAAVRPYLSAWLALPLSGTLGLQATAQWSAPAGADGAGGAGGGWRLAVEQLQAQALQLGERNPQAKLARLALSDARIDPDRQRVEIGRLTLSQPVVAVARDAQGRWMAQDWLAARTAQAPAQTLATTPAQAPTAPTPAPAAAPPPWQLTLGELAVDGGEIGWDDRVPATAVSLQASELRLRLRGLALDSRSGLPPAGSPPLRLNAALRIAAPAGGAATGTVSWTGSVQPAPLALAGELRIDALPLHALAPYAGEVLNVDLQQAEAGYSGRLELRREAAGTRLRLAGDARLDNLRAGTLPSTAMPQGSELLAWRALALRNLRLALEPAEPLRLEVEQTTLTDYFARVDIDPTGHLNLLDVLRTGAPQASTATATATAANAAVAAGPVATKTIATEHLSTPGNGQKDQKTPAAGPADVRLGPVVLQGGRLAFSDRFVRPNYSANISELGGRLESFVSAVPGRTATMAELQLAGRVENTAELDVRGRLDPLSRPPQLDIRGRMRDLELAPLTPYSVRHAGHGIERGKLSMDVHYQVRPDGQLTASNRIVLNQIQFTDKVEGATASLPVRLAAALLADRNGVIDIELPVSGSLNDPQFRLGPVIWRIIGNLIVRAVTAPFSLLAGALGGAGAAGVGEDLSSVPFEAGSAALTEAARTRLDKLAGALEQRPGLRLTIAGGASGQAEREALQRATLHGWLMAEQRRSLPARATPSASIGEAERAALLRAVYRRADQLKDRPRNAVGLLRELPPAEIEQRLLAAIEVGEQQARDLALARGIAVKDYLVGRALDPARLFLGAPRVAGAAAAAPAPAVAATTPGADAAVALAAPAAPAPPGPRADLLLDMR